MIVDRNRRAGRTTRQLLEGIEAAEAGHDVVFFAAHDVKHPVTGDDLPFGQWLHMGKGRMKLVRHSDITLRPDVACIPPVGVVDHICEEFLGSMLRKANQ